MPDASGDGHVPDAGADGGASSAPDGTCMRDGCLRAATHVGDYTKSDIEPFLDSGVAIDNGYSVYTLRYFTDGREALATVTVPYRAEAPSGGWHIVGNNHGTTGVEDPCALTGTAGGVGLAGLFGARGAIGVAPDYPGLGTDGVHPYLVADSEARAALDALRAARQLARWQGHPLSGRYAMVGLSQGGHATIAAAAAHGSYAPSLDLRAFGAAAPGSGWESHFRSGVRIDGPHQVFHAMLVYAWADHYGWDGPALWDPELRPDVDMLMETKCALDPSTGMNTLSPELGDRPEGIFSDAFLSAYESGDWGEYAAFDDWFERNRLGPYEQTAPLRIYQGDADAIVAEAYTRELVQALREGGVEVSYEVVSGGSHTDVAYGTVTQNQRRTEESIAWIFEQLGS